MYLTLAGLVPALQGYRHTRTLMLYRKDESMSTIFEEATHKSPGHIAVEYTHGFPACEWYERNGQVMRAPVYNAIDVDGYRIGRWECSKEYFDVKRDYLTQRFDLR